MTRRGAATAILLALAPCACRLPLGKPIRHDPVATPEVIVFADPIVSPDRLEDVGPIRVDVTKFPTFDNFAWRAFIALNWPALTDAKHRGAPDRTKRFGDP